MDKLSDSLALAMTPTNATENMENCYFKLSMPVVR